MTSMIVYAAAMGLFLLVGVGVGISMLFNQGDNTTRIAIVGAMAVATLIFGASAINFYLRTRDVLSGRLSQREGAAKLHTRKYRAAYGDLGYTTLGHRLVRQAGRPRIPRIERRRVCGLR